VRQTISKRDNSIGLVGTGALGSAIAHRLLDSNVPLMIFDTNAAAMRPLIARGAVGSTTPAAIADVAGVVFACLPSAAASREVALGDTGIRYGAAIKIYVELSTIGSPMITQIASALGDRDIKVVDSPVSGGPKGVMTGRLSAMVAGPSEAIELARPYLEIFASKVFEVGDSPGLAQVMKLANNLISIAGMTAAFEAMIMGVKAGLDPELMLSVLNASSGRNSATVDKIPQAVFTRTFDYGAQLQITQKDIIAGLEEAERQGVPMWFTSGLSQIWSFAAHAGLKESDFTCIVQLMEKWAGVEIKPKLRSAK
jgi:3-hydroxyisobutyrate dehydrogenase-like beta-hydroxyacid dehydrogenase